MKYIILSLTALFYIGCGEELSKPPPAKTSDTSGTPQPEIASPAKEIKKESQPSPQQPLSYNLNSMIKTFCPPDTSEENLTEFRRQFAFAIDDYRKCAKDAADELEKDQCRKEPKNEIMRDLDMFCSAKKDHSKIRQAIIEEMQ